MQRSIQIETLLTHIVSITSQYEIDGLLNQLAKAIEYLLPDSKFRIYYLRRSHNSFECLFDSHMPLDAEKPISKGDRVLLDTLLEDNAIPIDSCRKTIIYPVLIQSMIHSAVIIERDEQLCDEVNTALVKLLCIFANRLELLLKSVSDHLTGLFNRQKLNSTLLHLLAVHNNHKRQDDNQHQNQHHYFALFDVDFFKRINDNHGHLIGDEVLVLLAQKAQQNFREDDLVFRYGGEEFAVILKHVEPEGAAIALERFRKTIAEYKFPSVGQVTISIGYTCICEVAQPQLILKRADDALYYCKENGRNQINGYEQLIEANKVEKVDERSAPDIELF